MVSPLLGLQQIRAKRALEMGKIKKVKKTMSILLSILLIWQGFAWNRIVEAKAADVNSAPTVTDTSVAFQTISEDTDDSSNTGMAVSELLGLAGASDADGNTLSIAVTTVDDTNGTWQLYYDGGWWQLTRYKDSVSDSNVYLVPNGCSIRFKPGSNFNGQASFTFRVWDETTGTADNNDDTKDSQNNAIIDASGDKNGGSTAFSAKTVTASIAVSAVNDAPEIHKYCTNNSLGFDGTNDYVSVSDLGLNNGSFTVEGWLKVSAANNFSRFFDFGNRGISGNSGDHEIWGGFSGSDGKLEMELWNGDTRTDASSIIAPNQFPLGTWIYVSFVYNYLNQTGYIYQNGVLMRSGKLTMTAGDVARANNYFGRSNWSADSYFKGDMSHISVWKEARTAGEVITDMNANFSGSEANLVLYYPVKDAVGSETVTSATGTHPGSLMNFSSNDGSETSSANNAMIVNDNAFTYQVTGGAGTKIPIDQMYLKDVDAGEAGASLQLTTSNGGILAVDQTSGVSVTGTSTGTLTASGTVDDLNAALKTLTYNSASAVTDTITVKVDDNGESGSGGALSDSKPIDVTVIAPPANTPTILEQPRSAMTYPQGTAVFSVTASGSTFAYQWQLSKDGGSTWTDLSGATSSSYTINPTAKGDDGNQYRCYVYDAADNTSVTSDKATLNVLYPILKMAGVTPANGATGVDVRSQLSMTFNEDIRAVSGKNISVVDAAGASSAVEVTSSSVSVSGSTVTVTLPDTLGYTTKYHVLIDGGAFTDGNGTAYDGISDSTAWCFTTAAAPAVKPAPPIAGSGGALSFDGTDDYVNVPFSSSYSTDKFSVELWMHYTPSMSSNFYAGIISRGYNNSWSVVTVKRDSVIPSIHVAVSGTTGQWTEDPVVFTLSNQENNISPVIYWVKVGSGDWTPISGNVYKVTGNVNTTFQFKAVSGPGLTSSASDTYTVKFVSDALREVIGNIDSLPDPSGASDKQITDSEQAIKDTKILYDTLSKDKQSAIGQSRIDKLNELIGRLNALLVLIPKDPNTGITAGNIGTSVRVPELNDPNVSKVVVQLVVDPVSNTALSTNASTTTFALGNSDKSIVAAYDVSLLKTVFDTSGTQLSSGKVSNLEIDGPVTIRIPVPSEYIGQAGLQVVYISDAGAVTPMPTTLITVDGIEYLQFTTTHFSIYAITVSNTTSAIPNPKTWDEYGKLLTDMMPLLGLALFPASVAIAFSRKKRNSRF